MKKVFSRALLISVFFVFGARILIIFLSEIYLSKAKAAQEEKFFMNAQNHYSLAFRLNPYNADILAGYAKFLSRVNPDCRHRPACLKKAELFYSRAAQLDPRNAEYFLELGMLELAMIEAEKSEGNISRLVGEAMANFKKALANDPYGFNISYSVGYAGITIWDYLGNGDREFVLERLKHALELQPLYHEYIYPALWKASADYGVLKKIRPSESTKKRNEKADLIARLKRRGGLSGASSGNKVSADSWESFAPDGGKLYEAGKMNWSGSMHALIYVPGGDCLVKIRAGGQAANGIDPYMIVELDGEEIGETFVKGGRHADYAFKIDADAGAKVLSVTFLNDYYSEKEDRNLFIEEVSISLYEG